MARRQKSIEHDIDQRVSHSSAKGLLLISLALMLFCALFSFDQGYPSENWLGILGYYTSFGLIYAMGLMSYFLCFSCLFFGTTLIYKKEIEDFRFKLIYLSLILVAGSFLLNVLGEIAPKALLFLQTKTYVQTLHIDGPYPYDIERINYGGVVSYVLYKDLGKMNLQVLLSDFGLMMTSSLIVSIALVLFFDLHVFALLQGIYRGIVWVASFIARKIHRIYEKYKSRKPTIEEAPLRPPYPEQPSFITTNINPSLPEEKEVVLKRIHAAPFEEVEAADANITFAKTRQFTSKEKKTASQEQKEYSKITGYTLPPLALLSDAKKVDQSKLKNDLTYKARVLEETLASFGIEAKVGNIHCGPTITSFEVHPAIGVKVQKIKTLENDIALNMQAKSIRIIAPIPGKAAVGVEIPSILAEEVGFKEMLISYKNQEHKHHIPFLLGKTVSGEEVFSDLTKMPHCLIAGATGSGKSVCINTMIMSILMNKSPDEVKLLLVDPKKVELTPFSALPHLITPVITESKGAYAALQWMVKEMTYRYEILKQLGLRNIHAFNKRKINVEVEDSLDIDIPEKMYYLVAIFDEFADLMMTSSADLETPIARIAQMARAVGIHLILATQRPSREVITGLIKANFPTRIAFKVSSRINSQIILDENGAETLLGNGDMLFLPPASSQLIRAQGVFIRDEDIQRVTEFISDRYPPNYLMQSFDDLAESESLAEDGGFRDELYARAHDLVLQYRVASTTFLQRKLKIGYARAASLMDELEEKGVISPPDGSKARRILK